MLTTPSRAGIETLMIHTIQDCGVATVLWDGGDVKVFLVVTMNTGQGRIALASRGWGPRMLDAVHRAIPPT